MAQKKAKPAKAASKSKSKAAVAKAKKPAAKKPAAKKPSAKKIVAKKPAAKKPAAKKPAAKKPVAKKVVQKKPLAKKLVSKAIAVKKEPTVDFEKKRDRKAPPKMKKMVVKPVPPPVVQEDLYENESKDFAFAFAESMLKEQQEAEARRTQDASDSSVKLPKRPTSRVRGESTLKFSPYDLAQFRKSLLALRDSIVGKTVTLKTNALEQTIDRAGEDEDGSDSFMRLQNLGQVGEQNKTLQKIEEALHRIEDGTYGICEVCGQLIRKPRLQHLPFAHTCMECQSAMESNPDGISS